MFILAFIQLWLIAGIAVMLVLVPLCNAGGTCNLDIVLLVGGWPLAIILAIAAFAVQFYIDHIA